MAPWSAAICHATSTAAIIAMRSRLAIQKLFFQWNGLRFLTLGWMVGALVLGAMPGTAGTGMEAE
ncbi:hypothetical protein D3C71_1884780 [compost metagenome]